MENYIEKIVDCPECPQLTTLFLQKNWRLAKISIEFFRSMTKLLVLDLSQNFNLAELPEEISELVSLRYLNLSFTNIERLPIGLQELKMLIHLNLEETRSLESLDGISKLSSLRTLRLESSKVMLDISLMKELELLECLEYITTNISTSLFEKQLLYDSRVWRCIQKFCIKDLRDESVRTLVLPSAMINLHHVYISRRRILEIKIEKTSWNIRLSSPCFSNLFRVSIHNCDGLQDLTWLLFAPNLTSLDVGYLKQLKAIISKEKAEEEETYLIVPFGKLQSLRLESLPELKSIYWSSLLFPCLTDLYVLYCPNLRKLPLDSKSVVEIEKLKIQGYDRTWTERIEWEDEATKLRFLRCFTIHQLQEHDKQRV